MASPIRSAGRNTTKIAIWTVGILLLVFIGGVGSCVYTVGQRVHQKLVQTKLRIEQAKPGPGLESCSAISQEELTEIYQRPFSAAVKDGGDCRYEAGSQAVSVTVLPDFLLFVHATQQYHAHTRTLYGARSFFADGTLFLSYNGRFVKIRPLRGRSDAEEIAKLVLARL